MIPSANKNISAKSADQYHPKLNILYQTHKKT